MSFWVALAMAALPVHERIRLEWDAPPECPDAADLQRRMAASLPDDSSADAEALRVHGRIATSVDGYVLELRIDGPHGSGDRRLEAKDCSELAQAAALIIAVAIDPTSSPAETIPEPPQAPVAIASSPAAPVARTPAATAPSIALTDRSAGEGAPTSSAPRFAMRGGLGFDTLSWRPIGLSTMLGLAVLGRRWRVDMIARYSAPSVVSAAREPALRARVQAWSIGSSACGVPTIGRTFELPLCGGIEVGAWHAHGIGNTLAPGRRTRALWLAASAGPGFIWRFTKRLALWSSIDAVVLLARPEFVTDQGTRVMQPSWAGLRALAGLEFRSAP